MTPLLAAVSVFTLSLTVVVSAYAQPAIQIEGRVTEPGEYIVQPGARLLEAFRIADVAPDAYILGAAWLRRSELRTQSALKAGLLFDLKVLASSDADGIDSARRASAALARRLAVQVAAMPVTGRRINALDPVRLELDPPRNRPLAAGDRLYFPARPRWIKVTGAVDADCVLPFVGMRPASTYVDYCPPHSAADTDWLYVIQPDGTASRVGIAGWNRGPARMLAPGAYIYVPLRHALLEGKAEQLNDDFATFLGTQLLPQTEKGR